MPNNNLWGGDSTGTLPLYSNSPADSTFSPQAISAAGGNQPHENMQPYLVTTFCISLEGIYPSQG